MERMDIEELKDYYKARVEPYGKPMNEILEEFAKETKAYKELEEENKKLNIKVASLEGEIKGLNYTIEKLKEENQTLELWLDNKEKLNEEYRKQIDKLREELSAYDREYFDEDKKAKNIYKKQYEHSMGEDDELIYEEGLYD